MRAVARCRGRDGKRATAASADHALATLLVAEPLDGKSRRLPLPGYGRVLAGRNPMSLALKSGGHPLGQRLAARQYQSWWS